jgi:hypothetical protein
MNKQAANLLGLSRWCSSAAAPPWAGGMVAGATTVDLLAIASAFGFTIVAMAYAIGRFPAATSIRR